MKPPLGLPAVDGTAADAEYGISLDQQLAIACRCPCLRLAGLQATDCREDLFVHVAHALLAEQHPFLCCTCIL